MEGGLKTVWLTEPGIGKQGSNCQKTKQLEHGFLF